MNNHWALALVKGIREPHEVKKKSFDLGGKRSHDLRIGSTAPPRSKDFFFTSCGSLIPFAGANAQWVMHGFELALKFTLQN